MRTYRIIPDVPLVNGEGKCNNPSCPTPTIYWNDAVLNADTGKKLPLDEPFTGLRPPRIHECMKKFKPGVFLDKYDNKKREEENWNKLSGYTGPPPPVGVHLGTTHLWLEDKKEFVQLYKCPLCNFQNIHKDVINHHIKFAFDTRHNESNLRI